MNHRWQPLAFVAAVSLTAYADAATAQTVIVKGAPAGSQTELVLNTTRVASATVNAEGLATLTVPASGANATDTEAHLFVDRCGDLQRVVLVEGSLPPPNAEGACVRQALPGFYIVRSITTFVVEVGGPSALVFLTQGRPPASWLRSDATASGLSEGAGSTVGLVLFGGPGLAMSSKMGAVACGTVGSCTSKTMRFSYAAGLAYWFSPFVAAEAQYVAPGDATFEGSATSFRFNSSLETRVLTMAGLVAAPAGRARVYGRAGLNRHRAVLLTTQTVDDQSVTTGEVTQTIPGGTQTLELRTAGWGYVFGGGVEVWLSRWVALYGDLNRASLKGSAADIPDVTIDEAAWLAQFGVRVRIGR